MKVELVRDEGNFFSLKPEWDALHVETGSKNPFTTFGWCATWWKHFRDGRELRIFVLLDGGKMRGILPFILTPLLPGKLPPRRLELPGIALADWEDLLLHPDTGMRGAQVDLLFDYLAGHPRLWDWLYLKRIFEQDGPASIFLERAKRRDDLSAFVLPSEEHPYIPVEGSWEDYLAKRSGKQRYNLRRAHKLLDKEGAVEFVQIRDPDEIDSTLRAIDDISRKSQKFEKGMSLLPDARHRAFFLDLAGDFLPRGWMSIWQLKVDGKTVGCEFSFVFRGKYYGYYIDFDPAYSRSSPGLILLGNVIKYSFDNRLSEFHLGAGGGLHKNMWSAVDRQSVEIHVLRKGLLPALILRPSLGVRRSLKRSVRIRRLKTRFNHMPLVVKAKRLKRKK